MFVIRVAHLAGSIIKNKIFGGLRSHFQISCLVVDFKRALRPFYFCELDLMGHRWPKAMAI